MYTEMASDAFLTDDLGSLCGTWWLAMTQKGLKNGIINGTANK